MPEEKKEEVRKKGSTRPGEGKRGKKKEKETGKKTPKKWLFKKP